MDNEQLKSKIREALGAAGIGRDITENVDKIIDSMAGQKQAPQPARTHREEDNEAKAEAHAQSRRQAAAKDEDDDEDEDEAPRVTKAAETRTKPARKTSARKKK